MEISSCSRCLLNTEVPGIKVDEEGICSACREYDRVRGDWDKYKKENVAKLEKILDNARKKKSIYDVVVPLSGGKDSTYVLYLCKKHFSLNCLAVTWDNGFLSEHARENIRNACELLGVDHMYYGINMKLLIRLYRFFFLKTGFFCPVCMRGIQVAISRAQLSFSVPLAVRGTSRRTEEHISHEFFIPGDLSFLENVLQDNPLKKEASALLYPVGILSSPPQIQLPNYIEWDYDEIYKTIKNELGWEAHSNDAEHADCKVADIVDYIRYKKFPVLIPEMLRFSKLVTAGQMTKEDAQRRVAENRSAIREPDNIVWFQNALGITGEEMDSVLAEPLCHMKYKRQRSRVWRRIHSLKHQLFH